MAKHAVDAVKVLTKSKKILSDLLMTEDLKSAFIQYNVFEAKTIEELFMVSVWSVYGNL